MSSMALSRKLATCSFVICLLFTVASSTPSKRQASVSTEQRGAGQSRRSNCCCNNSSSSAVAQEPPLISYVRHRLHQDLAALHPDSKQGGQPRFVASIISYAYTNSSVGDLPLMGWVQDCCCRRLGMHAAAAYERPFPALAAAEALEHQASWVCSEANCRQLLVGDAVWQQGAAVLKASVLEVYGGLSWNSLTLSVLLQQSWYNLQDARLDAPYRQLLDLLRKASFAATYAPAEGPAWATQSRGDALLQAVNYVLRYTFAYEVSQDFHSLVTRPQGMADCRNISSWYDSKQQLTALGASCRRRTQHAAAALARSGWSTSDSRGSISIGHASTHGSPPQESALRVFARKRLAAAAELAPAYAGLGRANMGPGQPEGYPAGLMESTSGVEQQWLSLAGTHHCCRNSSGTDMAAGCAALLPVAAVAEALALPQGDPRSAIRGCTTHYIKTGLIFGGGIVTRRHVRSQQEWHYSLMLSEFKRVGTARLQASVSAVYGTAYTVSISNPVVALTLLQHSAAAGRRNWNPLAAHVQQYQALLRHLDSTDFVGATGTQAYYDAFPGVAKLSTNAVVTSVLVHVLTADIMQAFHQQVTSSAHLAPCRNISNWFDSNGMLTHLGRACQNLTRSAEVNSMGLAGVAAGLVPVPCTLRRPSDSTQVVYTYSWTPMILIMIWTVILGLLGVAPLTRRLRRRCLRATHRLAVRIWHRNVSRQSQQQRAVAAKARQAAQQCEAQQRSWRSSNQAEDDSPAGSPSPDQHSSNSSSSSRLAMRSSRANSDASDSVPAVGCSSSSQRGGGSCSASLCRAYASSVPSALSFSVCCNRVLELLSFGWRCRAGSAQAAAFGLLLCTVISLLGRLVVAVLILPWQLLAAVMQLVKAIG